VDRVIGQGVVLNRSLSCIRATTALAAVAIIVAGCAAANNTASSQGSGQAEQPYKTAYGLTSEGPTTDLYTELFGSSKTAAAPATATPQQGQPMTASAAPQPVQPVTAPGSTQPPQPATTAATRQNKSAMAARQVQPAPAPVEVAQQPAAPQPPPEPDIPTAYGITANGPTTDLYTELFGPRRRDGQ
jgi:hypothetical protein